MDDIARIFRSVLVVAQLEPDLIPRRLKEARRACGKTMTQERVAELLAVHKRTVENDEKTASNGVWERLNAYGQIYDKPVEWFLWGDIEVVEATTGDRLEALEATVEQQGKAMTKALTALAKEVRAQEPRQETAAPRARKRTATA